LHRAPSVVGLYARGHALWRGRAKPLCDKPQCRPRMVRVCHAHKRSPLRNVSSSSRGSRRDVALSRCFMCGNTNKLGRWEGVKHPASAGTKQPRQCGRMLSLSICKSPLMIVRTCFPTEAAQVCDSCAALYSIKRARDVDPHQGR
jgi:hypothetical protein